MAEGVQSDAFFDMDAAMPGRRHFHDEIMNGDSPKERFSDVGGLHHIVEDVRDLIRTPLEFPDHFSFLGIEPHVGVLLHGPPGCGKTLLAHAIGGELASIANFVAVAAPELVGGTSGESEDMVFSS